MISVFLSPLAGAESVSKVSRTELANLMTRDHVIIGKKPDPNATYPGRCSLRARGTKLAFSRVIDGRTVRRMVTLELAVVGDPASVLRM